MRSISPVIHFESSRQEHAAGAIPRSYRLTGVPTESAGSLADDHHARLDYSRRAASFFERRRQFLLVRVDHEHGQQFRGCGLARILANGVPITGHLGEALPGAIGNDRPIIDRTSDRSFENSRIDESMIWHACGPTTSPGTIFDEHTLDALAGHIGQSVFVDERNLSLFRQRLSLSRLRQWHR